MPASDRSARARNAALTKWSQSDPVSGTAAARGAFLAKFDDEVDPARALDPVERERRAARARRVYMSGLASKRHRNARPAKRQAKRNGRAGDQSDPANDYGAMTSDVCGSE
jgi:hypothetical protein